MSATSEAMGAHACAQRPLVRLWADAGAPLIALLGSGMSAYLGLERELRSGAYIIISRKKWLK